MDSGNCSVASLTFTSKSGCSSGVTGAGVGVGVGVGGVVGVGVLVGTAVAAGVADWSWGRL